VIYDILSENDTGIAMQQPSQTEFHDLMTRAGINIEETARLLGVNDRTVRRYIDGEGKRVDELKLEKLREVANSRCVNRPSDGFRIIDLFARIGGLRRPFEEIGGRCIFTSEWDRFSKETYAANFPESADSDHQFVGDIRPHAEKPESVPEHDVLLAGFPCQPFSIAGVSKKMRSDVHTDFFAIRKAPCSTTLQK
jgi:DNA (cytosine-5)-methyltransferase 1